MEAAFIFPVGLHSLRNPERGEVTVIWGLLGTVLGLAMLIYGANVLVDGAAGVLENLRCRPGS